MTRKLVVAGTTALLIAAFALPGSAAAQGASGCQPAAGPGTAALAHQLGGLGTAAKAVATSQPGAISELNRQDLFNCP